MSNYTFRFDDVCINADMKLIQKMTDFLFNEFGPRTRVLWGISPLVHDMSHEKSLVERQRIFPRILNAYSDPRNYYLVDRAGIPQCVDDRVELAAHGLIHVDHRLLSREAQEMSILVSNSLAGDTGCFIPPFNKWDQNTEDICDEHGIELVKFEDGWLCMEYNDWQPFQELWYLHAREFTFKEFVGWFRAEGLLE